MQTRIATSNEGICAGDTSFITLRNKTVTELVQMIQQYRIVQVRGPPYSGKTSLAQATEIYVRREYPGTQIVYITFADAKEDYKFGEYVKVKKNMSFFILVCSR